MPTVTQKILYGCSEAGISAVETFIRIHLLVFYGQILGLPVAWVAIALAISILWDAFIDPLIGKYSDDFKNRKGTRIHLMLIGGIATALSLAALFHPPATGNRLHLWLYLLALALVFNTALSLFSIPYSAMVGDYTSNRLERSGYIGWRMLFANIGALIGIGVPGYYLAQERPDVYTNSSWLIVMLVLFVSLLTSMAPPNVQKSVEFRTDEKRKPLKEAFTNKDFLFPLLAFLLVGVGLTLNTSLALYYYRIKVQLAESEIQNVFLFFFLFFSLSIPVWIWLSKKWSRKKMAISGLILLGVSNFLIYPNLASGSAAGVYILAAFIFGLFAGSSVLMDLILTDVVDEDHFKYGIERFGLFFGLWKFTGKISRALALVVAGSMLEWANVSFPDIDTPKRLGLIFGPGVGFFFVIAALLLIPYSLTEKKCDEINAALEQKTNA